MQKIIFLDFDGVLNTECYQGLLQYQGKPWQDEYGAFFDPKAVRQLKRIIDATGVDIVVESSWKYLGLEAMQELWRVRNLPGKIIDITPAIVGCNKGEEIAAWLSNHATQDTRYVIIDDEYVVLDSQMPYFIWTNPYEGLTEDQANRAMLILNRE
ncbi:MAG: hypothetical protein IJF01_04195 [Tidjanibacter sp.]|nr:hypothetical protein [Tidjanibacter sp.]